MGTMALGNAGSGSAARQRIDVPTVALIFGGAAVGAYVGFEVGGPHGAAVGALVGAAVGGVAAGVLKRLTVIIHCDGSVEIQYETVFE
jgi:hypothetical protein